MSKPSDYAFFFEKKYEAYDNEVHKVHLCGSGKDVYLWATTDVGYPLGHIAIMTGRANLRRLARAILKEVGNGKR